MSTLCQLITDEMIKEYGFEDEDTIRFTQLCEESEKDMEKFLLYLLLTNTKGSHK